ncbi:hypothetical protein AKJ64_02895 [candidate division MSBL1 archaeon SCGC-AAA259E17]|uniref:Glycosyl transferase family 1 n=1 Tax=candidate division MSBL1 archaeon SCGC-AAA259E17 TaxID=1698263 RepID=A0A133UEB6_9EURY|nr:hypothetical protein AKJ64_02895 [candidate division MSBL1 archaeon SCGC-AAA259E17]
MRIALATDTYHPQINGVVSSIDTIVEELEKEHEVHVFAPTESERAHSFRSFPFYPYPEYKIAYVRPEALAETFEEKEIEIVHVQTPFSLGVSALGASRRLSLPAVGTFHTLLPEYVHYLSRAPEFLLRKFGWKYITWFYGRFNAVTVPSKPIKKSLVRRGLENVYVIPNAVNTDFFHPGRNSSEANPSVLFVGRLAKEKNLKVLIDAAPTVLKEYPDTKFRIIGKGIHGDWYRELVKRKNLSSSFNFEGYVPSRELIEAYQECQIFAMPSTTETQGLVALEAMACETPVVGADARGLKDVISHGMDGYLFQPGDLEALSDYLLRLLSDDKSRKRMGEKARQKAEEFSSQKIGKQWTKFYSSLLG